MYASIIKAGFYFLNPEDEHGLFEMLDEGLGIRAALVGQVVPNMEMKFVKYDLDRYSLLNRTEFRLGNEMVFISPLEMQIA